MALIVCQECGGKVSSLAAACPHCGAPPSGTVMPPLTHPVTPPEKDVPISRFFESTVDDIGELWERNNEKLFGWIVWINTITALGSNMLSDYNFFVRVLVKAVLGAIGGLIAYFLWFLLTSAVLYLLVRFILDTPVFIYCYCTQEEPPEWPRKVARVFGSIPYALAVTVFFLVCAGIVCGIVYGILYGVWFLLNKLFA